MKTYAFFLLVAGLTPVGVVGNRREADDSFPDWEETAIQTFLNRLQ